MNDTLGDIEDEFIRIFQSNEKNKSKARDYRDLLERVLYYISKIPRSERHSMALLVKELTNHPWAFRKKLQPRATKLYSFFSEWSHDNPSELDSDALIVHQQKLKEFMEDALESTIVISQHTPPRTNRTQNHNTTPSDIKSYFKIAKNWYGKGLVIKVKFKRGPHQGQTYIYDHDKMHDATLHHLKTLSCWDKDGYYSSSNNIPGWAENYLINTE